MTRQMTVGGADNQARVGGADNQARVGGADNQARVGGADNQARVGGADNQARVRGRKSKPGRITFVGSGPGDPGLLTTRAQAVLAHAELVFTDPDVPEAVLALVGTDL